MQKILNQLLGVKGSETAQKRTPTEEMEMRYATTSTNHSGVKKIYVSYDGVKSKGITEDYEEF